MAFSASTRQQPLYPSWETLATLRMRGQVPAGAIWVCESRSMARKIVAAEGFAVPPPEEGQGYLVAGLEVLMYATRTPENTAAALVVVSGNPRRFTACWLRSYHPLFGHEYDWEYVI